MEPPPRGSFLLPKTDESEVMSMARAPDPRIEKAKAMYLEGMKLVEIASQHISGKTNARIKIANVRKSESAARSRGTRTALVVRLGIRKQLLRESLRLSFLIVWNRRSGGWHRQFRKIKRRCLCRRSSFLRFGNAGC